MAVKQEVQPTAQEFKDLLLNRMRQEPANCDVYRAIYKNLEWLSRLEGGSIEMIGDTLFEAHTIHAPHCKLEMKAPKT